MTKEEAQEFMYDLTDTEHVFREKIKILDVNIEELYFKIQQLLYQFPDLKFRRNNGNRIE